MQIANTWFRQFTEIQFPGESLNTSSPMIYKVLFDPQIGDKKS